MAQQLPSEILSVIFEHLSQSEGIWETKQRYLDIKRDLLACSEVCKKWHSLVVSHLYTDITFRSTEADSDSDTSSEWQRNAGLGQPLLRRLRGAPYLGSYIRNLYLEHLSDSRLLEFTPHLEELWLDDAHARIGTTPTVKIPRSLPVMYQLQGLYLHDMPMSLLQSLLSAAPALQWLSLQARTCRHLDRQNDLAWSQWRAPFTNLSSLIVASYDLPSTRLLRCLLEPCAHTLDWLQIDPHLSNAEPEEEEAWVHEWLPTKLPKLSGMLISEIGSAACEQILACTGPALSRLYFRPLTTHSARWLQRLPPSLTEICIQPLNLPSTSSAIVKLLNRDPLWLPNLVKSPRLDRLDEESIGSVEEFEYWQKAIDEAFEGHLATEDEVWLPDSDTDDDTTTDVSLV